MLNYFALPLMTQPEMYIQTKPGLIDDEGNVTVEATRDFFTKYMADYRAFLVRVLDSRRQQA